MRKLLPLLLLIFLFAQLGLAHDGGLPVYIFWAEGCPHCHTALPFLEGLEEEYPIDVHAYEVHDPENNRLFKEMAESCGFELRGVPTIFVGGDHFIGFRDADSTGKEIIAAIEKCIEEECPDPGEGIVEECEVERMVNVPLYGMVDVSQISLPVFTVMIGFLDGFNPCAMWVLTFLLALLIYTKDRMKMLMVGGIFILTSGIIYYMFIAAWFSVFEYLKFLPWLRAAVGIGAILMGLVHIKDFFAFGKGFSLSIPESVKPKLVKKMSGLAKGVALPATLLGVVALAITVNFVELLCTAGFPMIYTNVLSMYSLPTATVLLYFALYIIMYMLDDAVVFLIAIYTMEKAHLSQKQGRWLKLVSGAMILLLGLILMFRPEILMFG